MKKTIICALICIFAVGSAFANGTGEKTTAQGPKEEKNVTLVFAEVNPLDTIVGRTDSFFKEQVEKLSGGSIKIDIQPSGVLGSENDVLDSMFGGGTSINMARISAASLSNYGAKLSKLLTVPYTFVSRKHFWNFAGSDLAAQFLDEPHTLGLPLKGLFYGEEGFRHFFTVKKVAGLADFKGLKLRVSNDPVSTGMAEGLGASPTVVSFGELYSALQTGVVDGAEQPTANYKSNAFNEVAPYFILDGHILGLIEIVITDAAWNSLSDAQQKAMIEASKLTQAYNAEISEKAENEVLEALKAGGTHIIEVADKTPWENACKKIVNATIKGNEALYQQIKDLK